MVKNSRQKRSIITCPDCHDCAQFNIEWVAGNGEAWQEISCSCGFLFTPADIWNLEKGFTLPQAIKEMIDEHCDKCEFYDIVAIKPYPDWYLKGNEDARQSHMEEDHK